jgi:WD40 repeat protein
MISNLAKIALENAGQLQVVGTLEGHTAPILSVAIAPNGRRVASGSMDGTARVWNLRTQAQASVLAANPQHEKIARVAFSPTNPDHLAAAIGRKPHWAAADLMGYVDNLMNDMFSYSTGKPVWRLWSLERETIIHTEEVLYAMSGTAGLTYSPDKRWLAVMNGVFDITSEPYAHAARLTENRVCDMAFSEDSQLLALVTFYEKMPESTLHHFVEIYQTGSWRKVAEIKDTWRVNGFSDVRFLPGTHDLLVRTSVDSLRGDGTHKLYRFKGDSFEDRAHVMSDVACFACHPDAGMVAIARYDGRIVFLDWDRQKPVATVQAYKPARQVKMPRGILIGGSSIVDDAAKSLYRASQDMAFSQDGKLLISADGDRVIRIWGVSV